VWSTSPPVPTASSVALKRIPVHGTPAEAEQARRRFRREAEVLASLDHPGIVRLLEVLDDGDDVVLVLPHLSGGTLADRVRTGGPLPAAEVEAIGPLPARRPRRRPTARGSCTGT
jgi:serine/threonine-protein kinase